MKKQRKVVSGTNYQTAGQPYESVPKKKGAILTDVKATDHEHDRATTEVAPSRRDQADPARRKLRPMWVVIPLVVIAVLMAVIWGGAYLIGN
ncbi:MAG: hypothetical protein ACREV9_00270 [Burkholderiales bacterium]